MRPFLHLPPGAAAVLALAPDQCRWPLGEPAEGGFGFCRSARALGSRYCAAHGRASRRGGRR